MKDFSFIEVGAFDGDSNSLTKGLADEGWKGFYFEPIGESAFKCKERHKDNNVTVYPVAVGSKNEIIEIVPCGQFSSTNADMRSAWSDERFRVFTDVPKWQEPRLVECRRLDSYYFDDPHLLVIDTEGMELEVLKGMGLIRPRKIIVEMHEDSPKWDFKWKKELQSKIHEYLTAIGYKKVLVDDTNTTYEKI